MKNKTSILAVPALLGLLLFNSHSSKAQSRTEYLLDKGWRFTKGDVQNGSTTSLNDSKWQQVTVPHDWAITGPFNGNNDAQTVKIEQNGETEATLKSGRTGGLPFIGTGWYRLKLKVPAFNNNKTAELIFDGAMSNAKVFVNGKEVGVWPYGYNSFHFDVSRYLNAGAENTLAVRLENMPEASRWYPGAGLYRNVHLVVTNKAHIPVWGTYVTSPVVEQGFAKVAIKTNVDFSGGDFKPLKLVTEIQNPQGKKVGEIASTLAETDLGTFSQEAVVKAPQLWSPETPALYTAITKLYDNGQVVDEYRTTFGIRTIKYESVKGFSLNGVYRKFKGVCNHHDLGPLGAAINKSALRRQLAILKDMGCDAIRTSHNMPAPELVELCDEMGFMMMVESFDEWKTPKVKNGYSRFFDEWSERDMVNMIHRDRNHPSVVMWSIGNEVPDQGTKGGNKIAKYLQDICHREDPTRPVTVGMNHYDASLKNNFASIMDIPGFNYKPELYSDAYNRLPQGFLLGSETASTVSSRGVYKFPVEFYKEKKYSDNQSSSYDFEACPWSQVPDDEFVKQDELQYVIGEFVWTGFDYLGEPTPYDEKWPSHSSYFGIVDLAGLPKDRFYLYRSRWNTTKPTLHILPHWTWPGREGEVTPVFCYTNYPSAELFVNGKSMGKQTKSNTTNQTRYRLMWKDVKYTPGTIKVVAYDAQGKAVAEQQVKTAGKPHHIELVSDRQTIGADGKDIAFVTAKVCDAQGYLCPEATNQLTFKVNGAGSYKAVANGDATNLQPFQGSEMKAFSGQLVVLVQSAEKAGNIQLQVASKGLKVGVINIVSK